MCHSLETLESRCLMSTTPGNGAISAAVVADHAQIQKDLITFKLDCLALSSSTLADLAAIRRDDLAQATTVVPLIQTMRSDLQSMRLALASDRLTEGAAVLSDESAILKDRKSIKADQGNATALAADRQQLLTDKIQLQNDMVAELDARITTRQNAFNTVSADGQAIVTAVQGDPNASAKLQADVTKWINDRTARLTTISADLQHLAADRTQLVTDLTAMQSST
jgi:hypothetical protein